MTVESGPDLLRYIGDVSLFISSYRVDFVLNLVVGDMVFVYVCVTDLYDMNTSELECEKNQIKTTLPYITH